MAKQNVFTSEKELGRLSTQNQLQYRSEGPIVRELFAGKSGLRVLDVGCNDGEKTVRWFSDPAVAKVLGLELDAQLAARAQEAYGGNVFRFASCDVEAENFPAQLEAILRREDLGGFDVIYLSYLLSHLSAPERLLRLLRPLLAPDGVLVVVDSDDSACRLEPEGNELFQDYLAFVAQDPYCGDRTLGRRLPEVLRSSGYRDIVQRCSAPVVGPEEPEIRRHILACYSFLEEDLPLLRANYPNNALYDRMEAWLAAHFAQMQACFLAENASVSMSFTIYTCKPDNA